MGTRNQSFSQNHFCVQQNKETHTGLKQHEREYMTDCLCELAL